MIDDKFRNFREAFSNGTAGCRRTCACGIEYYDAVNSYDWEEGEIEALEKNKKAKGLDHSCGDMGFEGREYVDACDCWHNRAEQLIKFLDRHSHKIAEYLTLEKKRKQSAADHSAVVR